MLNRFLQFLEDTVDTVVEYLLEHRWARVLLSAVVYVVVYLITIYLLVFLDLAIHRQ